MPSNFQDDALEIIYSEFRTIDTEGLKNRLALYFTQDTQSLTLSEYELYCNKVKEDIEYCDLILYQFGTEFEEDNRLDLSVCQIRNTINTEIRKKDFYFYQTGQKIHPSSNLFELIKEMEVWIIRILFFMKNLAIDGEKFESIINSNSSNTISKKLKKLFGKIAEKDSKYEDEDELDPGHSISRIIETFGYVDDKPKHLDEVTSSLGVFFMSLNHGTDGANIPTELALRVLFEKNTKKMNLEEIQFYKQNILNEYTRVDSKYKELLDECKKWSEYINTEDEEFFFIWGVNRIGGWPEYGHSKSSTVHKKATNCTALSTYLSDMASKRKLPDVDNILACLNASTYFMFSKSETLCFAAIVALSYWGQALNTVVEIDDRLMTKLITNLIVKCERLKVQHPNFFDKFYKVMNSLP